MANKIKLGKLDSAVIFRADGSMEMVLPKQEDNDDVAPSSLQAVRVATLFSDADLLAQMDERIRKF